MKHPRQVTVAIPTVSRLLYLEDALDSVSRQTFRDFEVIIGDNSGDPSYGGAVDALVARYADLDVTVKHHARNVGMVGNCNALVDAASGEYWLYLPDDDRLRPDCLRALVAALEATPNAGVAFSDHGVMDAEGRVDEAASARNSHVYGRDRLAPGFHPTDDLFRLALLQVFELQSMLFRREVIRELRFRESAGPIPDFDLQLRLWQCTRMAGVVYCAERLTDYRHHPAQSTLTTRDRDRLRAIVAALERNAPPGARALRLYVERLAAANAMLAMQEAAHGDRGAATRASMRAVALDPFRARVWARAAAALLPRSVLTTLRRARETLRSRRERS
jgi:glycosyltransferase involved in cell wall biosynthesis